MTASPDQSRALQLSDATAGLGTQRSSSLPPPTPTARGEDEACAATAPQIETASLWTQFAGGLLVRIISAAEADVGAGGELRDGANYGLVPKRARGRDVMARIAF
jgi:hypothetical protein